MALFGSIHAQTLPAYLPTNGLVGWWPFNGNANDESGNGNHGTVNGATLTAGRNGNANSAYDFDGNDFIQVSLGLPDYTNFSFAFSTRLNGSWGGQFIHLGVDQVGCPCNGFGIGYGGTQTNMPGQNLVSLSAGIAWHDCNHTVNTNGEWQFIVVVKTGNNFIFYVDGQPVHSESFIINSPSNSLFFGGASQNYSLLNGSLDDIAIYNRALSQEEITALYNGTTDVSGCTNATACNYNASATLDDGTCTFPAQTFLNCDGTCINDTDADGICNELETPTLPAYLPTNGLVGWWPFNGNANDESGNGNNGTVNGATLTADRNGNSNRAYSFDGLDDFIRVGHDNLLNTGIGDFSISLQLQKTGSSFVYLLGKRFYGLGNGYSLYLETDNTIHSELISNESNIDCSSSSSLQENQWEHVVVVFNRNSNSTLYINGTLQNSCPILSQNGDLSNLNDLFFGYFGMSGNDCINGCHFLNGKLDDIAIYNRALTQEEITAIYTGTSSNNNSGGGTAGTPAASVPAGIPYQAVIRDNAGSALVNAPVTVRFTLHQNTTDGTVEYQETQSLTTNAIGLINTQFGAGTATQGSFANINWSNTTKFIQVEANTGAGYVDMGTQQMMSVPFAYQANKAAAIKNAGLPVYADNAAAVAGGLTPGEMYRTANGDLKIVF